MSTALLLGGCHASTRAGAISASHQLTCAVALHKPSFPPGRRTLPCSSPTTHLPSALKNPNPPDLPLAKVHLLALRPQAVDAAHQQALGGDGVHTAGGTETGKGELSNQDG